ncbi:MAG: TlpA family protein disulfide reductase [Saprospiraceae bacterium]|nr:TlpA family protein disulfide reductase [Saprospiraceae bacterium]MBK7811964.1 TlpA family protein disulfide reductase [Saprospiraceae bacterium]MBK9632829.1 TlpA family protein disulfide reductase [Saprospiraceae bacterium]
MNINMKSVFGCMVIFLALFFSSCQQGSRISGNFTDAGDMNTSLERIGLDNTSVSVDNQKMSSGKFEFIAKEGFKAGLYRIRMGQQQVIFVLDGTEKDVKLSGTLAGLNQGSFEVSGSETASEVVDALKDLTKTQISIDAAQTKINAAKNPLSAGLLAVQLLGFRPEFVETHKTVAKTLKEKYADSEFTKSYESLIVQVEQQAMAEKATGSIQVGMPAPDIDLPSPKGKNFKLSDLKGKVVLIDFWASWCGPCRRANPHVVDIYKKYKSKGFTVYSVSLDGVDSRTKAQLGDDGQIKEFTNRAKDAWVGAIEKDGLEWDTHVSDLKKWECAPAQTYGVRSIPKTFLLDKDGNIAVIDPRDNLEAEVKKLL